MENKINVSAIELYSRKALKPFLDKYFTAEKTSGKDILKFCPIEQVNFFVIQQLFAKWQEENSKLKSPYFDFTQLRVQEALKTFMDQLSQHILVAKDDFSPLLFQAIFNTIFYTVAPVSFISQKYLLATKIYTEEEITNLFKYLKTHPNLIVYLKSNTESWAGKSGAAMSAVIVAEFGEHYLDKEVEDSIMTSFNEILAVLPSDFHYVEAQKRPVASVKIEEPKQVTINELMGKESRATALHLHVKNKIVDIRSAMSINQKFMFIKELFKGDSSAFEGAMSLADSCENYEKSVNALIDAYSQRFGWEIDSDEVNELFDLIGRKFYPENFPVQES